MIDLNYVIKNEKGIEQRCRQTVYEDKLDDQGKVVEYDVEKTSLEPMTLKYVIKNALAQHDIPGPDEALKRYELIMKIENLNEIEFYQEESDMIIDLVCKKYGVMYSGPIIKLLKN